MKYLIALSLLLSILNAKPNDNMTDIESPDQYRKDVQSMATSDFQCNLYIEKTGANLYVMSQAEQINDKKTISSEFLLFVKNSNYAMEYCQYLSTDVVQDMAEIQEGVITYYNEEFKKQSRAK